MNPKNDIPMYSFCKADFLKLLTGQDISRSFCEWTLLNIL